jgi:hypothetical protein
MFSSQILDLVIGLGMMYLFQSILISGINDLLVAVFSVRGKVLKKFLLSALRTKDSKNSLFEKMIESPFINSLKRGNRFPSEISERNFSDAIIETIVREDFSEEELMSKLKKNLNSLPESEFKAIIATRLHESEDNYEKFKHSIEEWYCEYMERTRRWYKKRVTYSVYLFAFIITLGLNVDSLFVMNELWKNTKLRESVVTMSEEVTKKEYSKLLGDTTVANDSLDLALSKIRTNYQNMHMLDFPITWAYAYHYHNPDGKSLKELTLSEKLSWTISQLTLEKFLGLIITTLAVSIGAPIWYDIIKNLVRAREVLKKKA